MTHEDVIDVEDSNDEQFVRTCLLPGCDREFLADYLDRGATCGKDGHPDKYASLRRQEKAPVNVHSPYSPDWSGPVRRAVLKRDDHRCQGCGISNEKAREEDSGERGLPVHHVMDKRHFLDPETGEYDHDRLERLPNLVALCWECHGKWEGIPLRPSLLN